HAARCARRACRPRAVEGDLDGPRQGRGARGLRPVDRRARLAHPRGDRGGPEAAAPHPNRARRPLRVRPAARLMRKLYPRIYLAVLASLAAFALASGLLWRQLGDARPAGHTFEVAGTLAQNVLPPPPARKGEQQAALEKLAGNVLADVALFANDRPRLAASFNPVAARIEELVGSHKSLLANPSHELRTPLTRIRMTVELMKDSADPKRKRDLEHDIGELDALIDEILLASRLDPLTGRDADEEVDLLALASEECARYEEADLDGEPVTVRGDPRLQRRMIRNLLENARRHGAPPIEVRVRRAEGAAELSVGDHGPGVPESEREGVFQPFHRSAGAREGAGAGLGLALVRQIARRHGGDVRYLGRQPSGSRFVVNLDASPHGGVS